MIYQAIVQAGGQADAERICQQWRDHPDNQGPASERLRIDYISSERKPNENDAVLKVQCSRICCCCRSAVTPAIPYAIATASHAPMVHHYLGVMFYSADCALLCHGIYLQRLRMEKRDKDFLDVIVHVGMLGEGFDHTRLSVAVVLSTMQYWPVQSVYWTGGAEGQHQSARCKEASRGIRRGGASLYVLPDG